MAHIVYVNSLAIINIPFKIHLAFHVHVGTLVMGYIYFVPNHGYGLHFYFETCLTLIMAYIFIETHMVVAIVYNYFEMPLTLAMAYIFVKMCLACHVPFKNMAIIYFLIKMCLAFHVLFETLTMAYIFIKMCLVPYVPFITSRPRFTFSS